MRYFTSGKLRLSPLYVVPTDDFTSRKTVRLFAISAQLSNSNLATVLGEIIQGELVSDP
jgi:hypothetical protein